MSSKALVAAVFLLTSVCSAGIVVVPFDVTIDTSSQSGNNGAIYFSFAGGLNADPASVTIDAFSVGAPGALAATPAPFQDGDVTGSLDSLPLTIDNGSALNDYEHYLMYGSTVTFHVLFNLPTVLTGNSGSQLVWQLTASDGFNPVLTNDSSGNIGTILYDNTGTFTTDTLGNGSIESIVPEAPEPSTVVLAVLGALLIGGRKSRRQSGR